MDNQTGDNMRNIPPSSEFIPQSLCEEVHPCQREQLIQCWMENVDCRLDILWRLRKIIFQFPLPQETEFYWGISAVKEAVTRLNLTGGNEDFSQQYAKALEILEEVIRVAIHILSGTQLSTQAMKGACEIGEMVLCSIENCGHRDKKLKVIHTFAKKPLLDFVLAQYVNPSSDGGSDTYSHILCALEYELGFQGAEPLLPHNIVSIKNASVIARLGRNLNPGAIFCIETSIRLLFLAWINGHPGLLEITNTQIEDFIQDSDTFRALIAYPQIGARIALIFMYNQMTNADFEMGFKPSTNYRVIQLLKMYLSYSESIFYTGPRNSSLNIMCILRNSLWTLPWLWRQYETDNAFVMSVTVAWIMSLYNNLNLKSIQLAIPRLPIGFLQQNYDLLRKILIILLNSTFYYESYITDGFTNVESDIIIQLNKLLWMLLFIMNEASDTIFPQSFITPIMNCFLNSVEREWIDVECWKLAVFICSKVPRTALTKAVREADVSEKLNLIQQIILREMEMIMNLRSDENSAIAILDMSLHLDTLTTLAQFTSHILCSNDELRLLFSKHSHFNSSLVSYIMRETQRAPIQSCDPELLWKRASSVGAIAELVVQTISCFSIQGNTRQRAIENISENHVIDMIERLLRRDLDINYVLAPLCMLIQKMNPNRISSTGFITLFKAMQEIRSLLLDNDTHKWCLLLPIIVRTIEAILSYLDTPLKRHFIDNPWNSKLIHKCLRMILENKITCHQSIDEGVSRKHYKKYSRLSHCHNRIDSDLLRLIIIIVSENPRWKLIIFAKGMETPPSTLSCSKDSRVLTVVTMEDLAQLVGQYIGRGKALGHGNAFQELLNAGLVIELLELLCGTTDICKMWKGRVERAKKQYGQHGTVDVNNDPFYIVNSPLNFR